MTLPPTSSSILVPPRGPQDSPIVILGDCPGQNEEIYRKPFMGAGGSLLEEMLTTIGIDATTLHFLNLFPYRPEKNNVEHYFVSKKETTSSLPPLRAGKYIAPWAEPLLTEQLNYLAALPAKVILTFGAAPFWALTKLSGVTKYRGVWQEWKAKPGTFILPTLHPSVVLHTYNLRSIVEADLLSVKTFVESSYATPFHDTPSYTLHTNPSIDQLEVFLKLARSADYITVDIETAYRQIRTVGFSVSPTEAFVIPFFNGNKSYWDSFEEEITAWRTVRDILLLPQPKIFHNGLYDIQYLWGVMGIPVNNALHDTMLLHHALQPEMQKSLGFLGSIYTNNPAWKEMRKDADSDDEDKEE